MHKRLDAVIKKTFGVYFMCRIKPFLLKCSEFQGWRWEFVRRSHLTQHGTGLVSMLVPKTMDCKFGKILGFPDSWNEKKTITAIFVQFTVVKLLEDPKNKRSHKYVVYTMVLWRAHVGNKCAPTILESINAFLRALVCFFKCMSQNYLQYLLEILATYRKYKKIFKTNNWLHVNKLCDMYCHHKK